MKAYRNLEFYRGKRVFVTGHTGFKGAWLCQVLIDAGAEVTGYALSATTEPNLFSLADLSSKMTSVIGDVRDFSKLFAAYRAANPEIIFHLAAQPLVRLSYEAPVSTYETNVMGTVHLLECVRTAQASAKSVLIVTTDKVYENREWVWGYRENDPLDGYDPYSNSKSCAELAVHSYVNSFFKGRLPAVSTARAGNVIGGGDFSKDRIIPDCIRAALKGKPVLVRNPYSIRPYQHVLEAIFAYLMIAERQYDNPNAAGWYNIGPDDGDCVTTGALVEYFCRTWGGGMAWKTCTNVDAPHEADFLKLDCSKLKATFGWRAKWNIKEAVRKTIDWTKAWMHKEVVESIMRQQILMYMNNRVYIK